MTAFQPPPPSPARSVNPDHSAFGTATLHAENRSADPPYRRRPDWRDRVLFSACRQEIFVGGDPNHVASAATATREYRRENQYSLPHQLVSFHSSSTTSCTSAPTHHPGFHNPANAACAYYHDGSGTPAITQWFRPDGTQMTVACGFSFGIFPRDSDPHPPISLAQQPPSYAPTGPTAIQPKRPRTHLPPHHQLPEPRPASFYDYQLHPRD